MSKPRTRQRAASPAARPAAPEAARSGRASASAKPRKARRTATPATAKAPRQASSPLTTEQAADLLVKALGDQLRSLCRVIERVGDDGTDVDMVLGHLAALASRPRRPARRGQERAWLLSALLRLLGASAAEPDPRRLPLLRRTRPSPGRIEVRPERLRRLHVALQGIAPHERASVVLVVQEGLSLDQASRVLGHSRQQFAEAYSEALEHLDDDLLEALMVQ